MVTPSDGEDAIPLFPELPDMWMSGLSLVGDSAAAGFSDDDGNADEGMAVVAAGWSPMPGDDRLVVHREAGGFARPWMWSPRSGELTPIDVGLPGTVTLEGWYPDADALLLHHDHDRKRTRAVRPRRRRPDRGG